ncbi:MAG: hypothetical protein HY791_00965 [Deltaproteobacteria bacterium]|nr:hypothetical protein [Deltaproteobacteria bacterium]
MRWTARKTLLRSADIAGESAKLTRRQDACAPKAGDVVDPSHEIARAQTQIAPATRFVAGLPQRQHVHPTRLEMDITFRMRTAFGWANRACVARPFLLAALGVSSCDDGPGLSLEVPLGARSFIYAESAGGGPLEVSAADLGAGAPDFQRSLEGVDSRLAVAFYDSPLDDLNLRAGTLPASSDPPTRTLPGNTRSSYEASVSGGSTAGWARNEGHELPGILEVFRFRFEQCLALEADADTLLESPVVAIVALDGDRVLVLNDSDEPATQLALVTLAGASYVESPFAGYSPTGAFVAGEDLYVATKRGADLQVWRGSYGRGFEVITSSTTPFGDELRFLALSLDSDPPTLFGSTAQSALVNLGVPGWRELWRGGGGNFRGGMAHQAGVGMLATGSTQDEMQVILHLRQGQLELEATPVPRTLTGLGFAQGSIWLGQSKGGVFRRAADGWESLEHPSLGDVRGFVDFSHSVVVVGEDGHAAEYVPGSGYCPAHRISEAAILSAARLGDDILVVERVHDHPNRVRRVRTNPS